MSSKKRSHVRARPEGPYLCNSLLKTSQWIFQFLVGYDKMALRHGEEIVWAALSNAATDHDTVLNLTHHTSFRLAGRGDILGLICSLPRGESRRHEPSLLLLCEQALRLPGSQCARIVAGMPAGVLSGHGQRHEDYQALYQAVVR
jgi:hypothetical protein